MASGTLPGEKSYENPQPSDSDGFRLVSSSDYQSGTHWLLNRETGVMEQTGGAASVARPAPVIEDGFAPDGSPLDQPATVTYEGTSSTSVWTRDAETGHYTQTETTTRRDADGKVIGSSTTVRIYAADGTELQAGAPLNIVDIPLPELAGYFTDGSAGGAYGAGQLAGFDVLPLDEASSFLVNEDGDIAAEITALPNGYHQITDLSGNTVYVSDSGEVMSAQAYDQAQAALQTQAQVSEAANAVGLANVLLGLDNSAVCSAAIGVPVDVRIALVSHMHSSQSSNDTVWRRLA
jgi:hypothetical protein